MANLWQHIHTYEDCMPVHFVEQLNRTGKAQKVIALHVLHTEWKTYFIKVHKNTNHHLSSEMKSRDK